MGNVDHGDSRAAKPLDRAEQPGDFACGQARRRFVHHDDIGVRSERPAHRNQRLLGPRQLLDAGIRIDDHAELVESLDSPPSHRARIDESRVPRIAEREADVLRDAHPIDQPQVLVDESDRKVGGRRFCAAKENRPLVGRVNASENLDQRRLPRAVLSEQGQDLSALEI